MLLDIDSARQRSTAVETSANASWFSKNISALLAMGSTLLIFSLFFVIIFRNDLIQNSVKDVVLYVLGVLSAIITQVFSFYFGSSVGSENKTKFIEGMGK